MVVSFTGDIGITGQKIGGYRQFSFSTTYLAVRGRSHLTKECMRKPHSPFLTTPKRCVTYRSLAPPMKFSMFLWRTSP